MSSPDHAAPHDEGGDDEIIREQDRLLPIANVARIMKQAVPSNAKIAKDAKETVQECVSEFISFITSEYAAITTNPIDACVGPAIDASRRRGKPSTGKTLCGRWRRSALTSTASS